MILNFLLIIILFFILFYFYIKIKFPFWTLQPVFHYYDFHYWFYNKGIINSELPCKNKYTNFQNIEIKHFENLKDRELKYFVYFIQNHYLNKKENKFYPKIENISPYFLNHKFSCYFSFYKISHLLEDTKDNLIIPSNKIIGVMTSRPLQVILNNNSMYIYYVDYLCIDKLYRKQNIAPQLIQTHEHFQSHNNLNINVSLFKREEQLTGIIPICVFKTYCFSMEKWITPLLLLIHLTIINVDGKNIYYIFFLILEFKKKKKWKMIIFPEISNLIELIKSENIFVQILFKEKDIKAVYFFRKVCTFIEKDKQVISCFGSIKTDEICIEDFINGFKTSLNNIIKKNPYFCYLTIEDISENQIIINNLLIKSMPIKISPTAYFFYNFAYETLPSNKILIIN